MADWSNLPTDALLEISDRLENGIDYVRFRSICSSWRSGAPKRPQFPWLAVIYKGDIAGEGAVGLYDFPKPHFLKPQLPDGIPKDKLICGSSRGWISILDRADTITLHNPFTGAQIELPPFTNLPLSPMFREFAEKPGEFMSPAYKLILSSDPVRSPSNCVVMGMITIPDCHDFRYGGYAGYACKVYQVELSGGHVRLRRMNHLGGRSLFLGIGSMSVSAGTFPRCKYNQIYLIQHSERPRGHPDHGSFYERRGNKIVALNVEDGSYSTISTLSDDTNGVWWSAYWLTPTL